MAKIISTQGTFQKSENQNLCFGSSTLVAVKTQFSISIKLASLTHPDWTGFFLGPSSGCLLLAAEEATPFSRSNSPFSHQLQTSNRGCCGATYNSQRPPVAQETSEFPLTHLGGRCVLGKDVACLCCTRLCSGLGYHLWWRLLLLFNINRTLTISTPTILLWLFHFYFLFIYFFRLCLFLGGIVDLKIGTAKQLEKLLCHQIFQFLKEIQIPACWLENRQRETKIIPTKV